MSDKLEQIVATYFADLRDKHGLGAGTPELSYYPAVAKLLDAIGRQLRPAVLCLSNLGNTGSGQPDFGLYVAHQVQKGEPRKGQIQQRTRHEGAASLLRPPQHSAHRPLHGVVADAVQGFLAQLINAA